MDVRCNNGHPYRYFLKPKEWAMRVVIFTDDYYLLYGAKALLRTLGSLKVLGVYTPSGYINSSVEYNADLIVVSFSSMFRVMNLLSIMFEDTNKVMVLADVKTARLLNFNCVKKNIGRQAFIAEMRRLIACNRGRNLSPRELLILALLLKGAPNTGIARMLGISEKTVSQHKVNAMRKLDVKHVCQLI
jgi:DNA-binding NarL/FixJ family response regulator